MQIKEIAGGPPDKNNTLMKTLPSTASMTTKGPIHVCDVSGLAGKCVVSTDIHAALHEYYSRAPINPPPSRLRLCASSTKRPATDVTIKPNTKRPSSSTSRVGLLLASNRCVLSKYGCSRSRVLITQFQDETHQRAGNVMRDEGDHQIFVNTIQHKDQNTECRACNAPRIFGRKSRNYTSCICKAILPVTSTMQGSKLAGKEGISRREKESVC